MGVSSWSFHRADVGTARKKSGFRSPPHRSCLSENVTFGYIWAILSRLAPRFVVRIQHWPAPRQHPAETRMKKIISSKGKHWSIEIIGCFLSGKRLGRCEVFLKTQAPRACHGGGICPTSLQPQVFQRQWRAWLAPRVQALLAPPLLSPASQKQLPPSPGQEHHRLLVRRQQH